MTTYSPPYALAQVSVNSGPPSSGAGVVIPGSATIAFTGASTTGWVTSLWEIYDYPLSWSTPSGWTKISATGVIQYSGNSISPNPPLFTTPTISLWGKWALRLTVNGGVDPTGAPNPPRMIDTSMALSMLSTSGLHDGMAGEQAQFATGLPYEAWTQDYKANLRILQALLTSTTGSPYPLAAITAANSPYSTGNGLTLNSCIDVDVTSGAVVINPPAMAKGTWLWVSVVGGNPSTHNLTVNAPTGGQVAGFLPDYVPGTLYASVVFSRAGQLGQSIMFMGDSSGNARPR